MGVFIDGKVNLGRRLRDIRRSLREGCCYLLLCGCVQGFWSAYVWRTLDCQTFRFVYENGR